MVEKSAAKASRKLKDKWKMKELYSIIAPEMFDKAQMGETLSDDPKKLINRIIEITAQDLTGDFTKMHIKLHFKIDEVKKNEAKTSFFKQELTSDYERRLARRKRTRIEGTFDVTTRDKVKLRVKPMAITEQRVSSSKQSSIRRLMSDELKKIAGKTLLQDFVKNILSGLLQRGIAQACKPIQIVQRVEIRKTEFMGKEKGEVEETGVSEELEVPPPPPPEQEEPMKEDAEPIKTDMKEDEQKEDVQEQG